MKLLTFKPPPKKKNSVWHYITLYYFNLLKGGLKLLDFRPLMFYRELKSGILRPLSEFESIEISFR